MQAISNICQIFSEQLGWSLRQETKDWSNILDDQEILCKKKSSLDLFIQFLRGIFIIF